MRRQYKASHGVHAHSPSRSPNSRLINVSSSQRQAEELSGCLFPSSGSLPAYCQDHPALRNRTPSPARSRILEGSLTSSPESPRTPVMSLRLAPLTPNAAHDPLRKPTLPSIVARGVDLGRYSPTSSFKSGHSSFGRDRFQPYFYGNIGRDGDLMRPRMLTSSPIPSARYRRSPTLTPTRARIVTSQATPKHLYDEFSSSDTPCSHRQSREQIGSLDSHGRSPVQTQSPSIRRMRSPFSDDHAGDTRYGDCAAMELANEYERNKSDILEVSSRRKPYCELGPYRSTEVGNRRGQFSQLSSSPSSSTSATDALKGRRLLPPLDFYAQEYKNAPIVSRSEEHCDDFPPTASDRISRRSDYEYRTHSKPISTCHSYGHIGQESKAHFLSTSRALSPLDELTSDSEDERASAENQSLPRPSGRVSLSTGNFTTLGSDGTTGAIFESPALVSTQLCTEGSMANTIFCRLNSTTHQCFSVVNGKWACYRRNYLKVDAAFELVGKEGDLVSDSRVYLRDDAFKLVPVVRFAMKLSAHVVTSNSAQAGLRGSDVPLIQFGPSRERGPRKIVQPLPIVHGGRLSTDYVENEQTSLSGDTVVAFRRVQIRSATLNNGHRGSSEQQYYALKLTLLAIAPTKADPERSLEVASLTSQPITVRGRSKMHYAPQPKETGTRMTTDGRGKQISKDQQMVSQVNHRTGSSPKRGQDQRRSTRLPSSALAHGADNADSHLALQDAPAMDLRLIL